MIVLVPDDLSASVVRKRGRSPCEDSRNSHSESVSLTLGSLLHVVLPPHGDSLFLSALNLTLEDEFFEYDYGASVLMCERDDRLGDFVRKPRVQGDGVPPQTFRRLRSVPAGSSTDSAQDLVETVLVTAEVYELAGEDGAVASHRRADSVGVDSEVDGAYLDFLRVGDVGEFDAFLESESENPLPVLLPQRRRLLADSRPSFLQPSHVGGRNPYVLPNPVFRRTV